MMGFAERLFVRRDYFSGPAKVVFFQIFHTADRDACALGAPSRIL